MVSHNGNKYVFLTIFLWVWIRDFSHFYGSDSSYRVRKTNHNHLSIVYHLVYYQHVAWYYWPVVVVFYQNFQSYHYKIIPCLSNLDGNLIVVTLKLNYFYENLQFNKSGHYFQQISNSPYSAIMHQRRETDNHPLNQLVLIDTRTKHFLYNLFMSVHRPVFFSLCGNFYIIFFSRFVKTNRLKLLFK